MALCDIHSTLGNRLTAIHGSLRHTFHPWKSPHRHPWLFEAYIPSLEIKKLREYRSFLKQSKL